MRLESTLSERPGMMNIAPILDVVMLLLIFLLLGSQYMLKSGIAVKAPVSPFSIEAMAGADIVTVAPGPPTAYYLNESEITLEKLGEMLNTEKAVTRQVVIRGDTHVSYGSIISLGRLIMERGHEVVLSTTPQLQRQP